MHIKRLALLLVMCLTLCSCAQKEPEADTQYYSDSAVQQLLTQWGQIPTMRMGVNYYLQYSQDYVSENDTSPHEKLYWGVSYNVVNGVDEVDYYGYGYALPEPYMTEMQELAVSLNEVQTFSENVFGAEKYKPDFYVREYDQDDSTVYIYRRTSENGFYRSVEPLSEYDEFTTLRPEYIKDLKSTSQYELKGTYESFTGLTYNVTVSLNKTVPVPKTMQLTYDQPLNHDGLQVDWIKCDYTFYDYDSELQMTDEIYDEASKKFSATVSSTDGDIEGNYYFTRYYQDYTPGEGVVLDTGDSYFKYSDTYFFSLPSDVTLNCTFTLSQNSSVSVDELYALDQYNILYPVRSEGGKWKFDADVTGDFEFQIIKIENNQNTTFTFTGDYMMERIVQNVQGAIPTTISQNYLDGSMINYLGQNIVIQEQSLMPQGQSLPLTEPVSPNQVITYHAKQNGDVELASVQYARKLATLDAVSQNVLSEYLNHYRHKPQYEVEQEVLDFFEYVRPVTEYLYSIYDITTYDLEQSDVPEDFRFYGYSTDRHTCISMGIIYETEDFPPTVYYIITQIYGDEER